MFVNKIYILFINIRAINVRTILGSIYLENTYINKASAEKAKTIWLIKKKGTDCGIYITLFIDIIFTISLNY